MEHLTNKELVKFIQKIGHYQAANIIEHHKIKGHEIFELTERDTVNWNLSKTDEELFWKCIHQLKLQYVKQNNQVHYAIPNKLIQNQVSESKRYTYYTYKPRKKQNNETINGDNLGCYDYEYIAGPISSDKNNFIVNRIKKYCSPTDLKNNMCNVLTNDHDTYTYINDRNLNNTCEIMSEKTSTTKTKKKSGFQFKFKTFCFSCIINCGNLVD